MLGEHLKEFRLNNNLTQAQMAEKLGTSQAYYNRLEAGLKKPGFKLMARISGLLDEEPAYLRTLM